MPKRELGGKLAGLTLPQQVMALAIWPFFEQIFSLMVGTVDLALAGRLDPQPVAIAAVDALGVTSFVGWLMAILLGSVGVGSTALVARAIGGRHRSLASAAIGQSMVLAMVVGIIVGVLLFIFAPLLGMAVGLEGQSLAFCVQYLRIVTFAAPANAVLMVANACMRGAGDTRNPFIVMVTVNVINAAASILLVFGPAPLGGHGVAGIAAGTTLAWFVGAVMAVTMLRRGSSGARLHLHRLRPHVHTMRRIVRVGLPNLIENAGGNWLATFIVLAIVGRLGTQGVIGAHMIAVRVESFSFQPGFALGIAAATLSGQYLGLGDPQRARRAIMLCWAYGSAVMTFMGLLFIIMPRMLARIITDSTVLLDQAQVPIQICGVVQLFFATYIVLSFALRGAGDTKTTMKMTYASVFTLRVPLAYVFGHVMQWGLPGVWVALCIDLTVRGLLFAARFLHGGWMRVKV